MSGNFITPNGTFWVPHVFIEGLKYLGTLKNIDFSKVDPYEKVGQGTSGEWFREIDGASAQISGSLHEAYRANFHERLGRLFEYASLRMARGGRDRDLSDFVAVALPDEPTAPLWLANTDIAHTVASFGYLVEICNRERFSYAEQKTVLSAMIVHDCAYPTTDDFRKVDVKTEHMVEGAKAFDDFARRVNQEFCRPYTVYDIEIEEIETPPPIYGEHPSEKMIIAQHDNPSIGRQFSYGPLKLLWAHREADRLWMLDKAGFALDLLRLLRKSKPYDPAKLLRHVIGRHAEEAELYQDNGGCRVIEEDLLDFKGRKTLYRTNTGFEIFLRLIKERANEYGINLSSTQS